MNKNLVLVMLLLVATVSAQAQVTIGSKKIPSPFSILELISGSESNNGNRGLRLPQLTTEERETMVFTGYETEALGLQIFNRSTRCVETWNGTKWIQSCGEDGARPATGQLAISITGNEITYRDFMAYNLGATEMSIKDQLLHDITATISENTIPGADNQAQKDAYTKVYGSKYQFGRQSDGHENVWSENTTTDTGVSETYLNTATGQVDPDQDIAKDYYGRFILGGSGSKYDWITENTSSANHYGTDAVSPYYHMYPGRWDGGYDSADGGTYTPLTTAFPSSTVKVTNGNDPCPAGFRVPSQVEWAGIFTDNESWSGSVNSGGINKWVWVAADSTLPDAAIGIDLDGQNVGTSGYLIYPAATAFDNSVSDYSDTPTLFLPAAGYRGDSDGSLNSGGSSGHYWSSTAFSNASGAVGYNLYFGSGSVNPTDNNSRAYGMSVRCVAD
jgi:uncharacterized protein (TIGR02145 family)